MLNIAHLAREYKMLPSQVKAQATTYDIMVYDVITTWERHQQNPQSSQEYDTNQLAEIMSKHKEHKKNGKTN